MFYAPITFLQSFKNSKPGACFAMSLGGDKNPLFEIRKVLYCKNFISGQNVLINFRLHCLLEIFNKGVGASQVSLLKKAPTKPKNPNYIHDPTFRRSSVMSLSGVILFYNAVFIYSRSGK